MRGPVNMALGQSGVRESESEGESDSGGCESESQRGSGSVRGE